MKKLINAFSITALASVGASLLLTFALLTVFWEAMLPMYGSGLLEMIDPVIPFSTVLTIVGTLAISILLLTTFKPQGSVAIEIVSLVLLVVGFPLLSYVASFLQQMLMASQMGESYVRSLSITTNILSVPTMLAGLARSLCLFVCGMRIAQKLSKK